MTSYSLMSLGYVGYRRTLCWKLSIPVPATLGDVQVSPKILAFGSLGHPRLSKWAGHPGDFKLDLATRRACGLFLDALGFPPRFLNALGH